MTGLTRRREALKSLCRTCRRSYRIVFPIVLVATVGCTSVQLEHSTEGQTATLADITSQVVLNNLAMFKQNPDAVPAQVSITQGSIQITDLANPSFMYTWPMVSRVFGISASRTWQESWTVVPVTDYATLRTLRDLYRTCASGAAINDKSTLFNEIRALPGNDGLSSDAISSWAECGSWLGYGNVPEGFPFGHYGTSFVWVKPGGSKQFGDLVMQTISASGNGAKTQAQVFPGAVMPH